jgi:hypothetical protein
MRAVAVLGLSLAACSFTRFSDIQKDAPVVVIDGSPVGAGFGAALSIHTAGNEQRLAASAVAGVSGAAEYELGLGQNAGTDAARTDLCPGDCANASHTAAVDLAGHPHCFAVGFGSPAESVTNSGVRLHCADGFIANLDLPAGFPEADPKAKTLTLAASANGGVLLAANSPLALGWVYPSITPGNIPTSLSPSAAFSGEPLALAVVDAPVQLLLVGDAKLAKIQVFQLDGSYLGCLSGDNPGFGKTIAVKQDPAKPLLAVADDKGVRVLHAEQLNTAPASCVDVDTAQGWKLADLGCKPTADVEGCDASFGAALAFANLDGKDPSEVIVGAPGTTVRGENTAGSVFVFDLNSSRPDKLSEAKFLSSAQSGDRLGSSLAVLQQAGGLETFVAGAPGASIAAIFYCPKLAGARGSRCQ